MVPGAPRRAKLSARKAVLALASGRPRDGLRPAAPATAMAASASPYAQVRHFPPAGSGQTPAEGCAGPRQRPPALVGGGSAGAGRRPARHARRPAVSRRAMGPDPGWAALVLLFAASLLTVAAWLLQYWRSAALRAARRRGPAATEEAGAGARALLAALLALRSLREQWQRAWVRALNSQARRHGVRRGPGGRGRAPLARWGERRRRRLLGGRGRLPFVLGRRPGLRGLFEQLCAIPAGRERRETPGRRVVKSR